MAGAGFKTFATGEVLTASDVNTYLMQQTVMVFADSTARSTALGANVAEGMLSYLKSTKNTEYYNGSAWVVLSTGGDITGVTAGYGLAGGGTSGDVTLTTAGGISGTNIILNSNFSVWQRGTSFNGQNIAGSSYWADRWSMYFGTTTGYTLTRQSVNDATNLPNIQYCARIQRANGTTGATGGTIGQSIEILNSIPLAGKTITFSFYARKGADYQTSGITANLKSGTGTSDANGIYNTYTGQTSVISQTAALTTTWQRFSYSATLAGSITQLAIEFIGSSNTTSGAADYYEITGVQIEVGASATAYQPNGKTYQGELAACQRYYYRNTTGSNYGVVASGSAGSTTAAVVTIQLPVPMRVKPTSVESANLELGDNNNAGSAVTAVAINANVNNSYIAALDVTVASGLTQYRYYNLRAANNTSAYLGLNAEL